MKRMLLALLLISSPAHAHDVYRDLHDPSGQLCCGGDPLTGDCEALTYDDLKINVDGSASFRSRRYGVTVLVAAEKITWLPIDQSPAHWCGRKRPSGSVIGGDQPDPSYWTYCAFIAPGGV